MKLIYSIVLSSLGCATFAQSNDTIRIKENENPSLIQSLLWQHPINTSSLNIKDYTQVGVKLLHNNKNLKQTQEAGLTTKYQFVADGYYNFSDKFKVFGDFKIDQFSEDELSYNLSSERTSNTNKILSPNYFYSPSSAQWKNQIYHISAGGSYEVFNNFYTGLAVNYENSVFNRTSDPRPKSTTNLLQANFNLGYKIGASTLSVNYNLSRNKLENETYFESKTLNPNTDPLYNIKFSSGYGYKFYNNEYSRYLNVTKGNAVGLNYSLKLPNLYILTSAETGVLLSNYYTKNNNSSSYPRPLEEDKFIQYKSQNKFYKANVFVRSLLENGSIESKLNFENKTIMNFIVQNRSTNYQYKNNNLNFEVLYSFNKKQLIKSIGIDAYYDQLNVKDLLGITEKQHSSIDFLIFAQNKFNLNKNNHSLFVNAGIGAFVPVKNALAYTPTSQDESFINNVVIADYNLHGTYKFNMNLLTHYDVPYQNKTIRFSASYKTIDALSKNINSIDSSIKGTSNYYTFGVSVIY